MEDNTNIFHQRYEIGLELASNYNYVNWLREFTEKHPAIRVSDCNNVNENITEDNITNIKKLIYFFDALSCYAGVHKIHTVEENLDGTYMDTFNVNVKKRYYAISQTRGSGKLDFFLRKVDSFKDEKEIIDFDDVVECNLARQISKENHALTNLRGFRTMVRELLQSGVSKVDLEQAFDEEINPYIKRL